MKDAHARLKYPIPFFQDAATVEYASIVAHLNTPGFFASFLAGPDQITTINERTLENGDRMSKYTARCIDLRPGEVEIRAKSLSEKPKGEQFEVNLYLGEVGQQRGKTVKMINPTSISRWRLGRIQVANGKGKDPIEVDIQYLEHPAYVQQK